MGKVGRSVSQEVNIELVHLLKNTFSFNCILVKIFIVKQHEIINECRKAFSFDNLNQVIKNRQLKFIAKFPV